jgi:hypothetical protein
MEDQDPPAVIVVEDHKEEITKDDQDKEKELRRSHREGKIDQATLDRELDKLKKWETGKARKLRVRVGIRDRVLHLVEILGLDDPEKKWQGSLETAKFVVERGLGLRNDDAIRLEVEEDEEPPADVKKEEKP